MYQILIVFECAIEFQVAYIHEMCSWLLADTQVACPVRSIDARTRLSTVSMDRLRIGNLLANFVQRTIVARGLLHCIQEILRISRNVGEVVLGRCRYGDASKPSSRERMFLHFFAIPVFHISCVCDTICNVRTFLDLYFLLS